MQNTAENEKIPIIVQERAGLTRADLPVRLGVPCPRGRFFFGDEFEVENPQGKTRNVQTRPIAVWPDGSTKWLLVDFFGNISADSLQIFFIRPVRRSENNAGEASGLTVQETQDVFQVNTGSAVFSIPRKIPQPFAGVRIQEQNVLSQSGSDLVLILPDQSRATAVVDGCRQTEKGLLRVTILKEGRFIGPKNKTLCRFSMYQTFFSESTLCSIDCVIHNPKAALHPGGLWDLGDPGSFYFKELSLQFMCGETFDHLEWQEDPLAEPTPSKEKVWKLYQDSSGLENWNSVNHIDQNRRPTVSFRGYRISAGTDHDIPICQGDQATPYLNVFTSSGWVAGTVRDFWQNFPKSLEANDGDLKIGLFPINSRETYELQGGERKRHTALLEFGRSEDSTVIPQMQAPLSISPDPKWIESTKAISWFTAEGDELVYRDYLAQILDGPHSFFQKRKTIDEFGWRNFGDIYADHEAVHHTGSHAFIAHYNNQYDFIYGGIVQFLRSGRPEWFELAGELARHVMDIDIYHTDEDKAAFNHGQFWHTDHYKEAHTCTHRGYSRLNRDGSKHYGGGPSDENDYASGLLHYYYLTGDPLAREAVLELAQWVIGMDDGGRTLFAIFDDGPTGLASQTADTEFHKPGRGAGNSINTLLDAFQLTHSFFYLEKAEALIRRCIHPDDDIPELQLDEPEYRWSYLVFLQVLGKYLDMKMGFHARDAMFFYARDSLLNYASWMRSHETPYKEVLHKVDLPTETWPAQDIRKNHVFHMAAKYAPDEGKEPFREKANYYFHRCLADLMEFDTAHLARPLVLLAVYGYIHAYFQGENAESIPYARHALDFGSPKAFVPQKTRFRRTFAENLRQSMKAARQLLRARLHIWRTK